MPDVQPSAAIQSPPGQSSPGQSPPDRAALLADLRARIQKIEGLGGDSARRLPFGVPDLDSALPGGGLPLGCLHEVAAEDPGAGTAFAAGLLARLGSVAGPVVWPVVWIVRGRDLHAAGLAAYGLTPDRLIAVRATRDADALWAMEEALRCKRLSAVLGETGALDLTASRRLQLAAESSGVTGVLLQLGPRRSSASAAVTRWRVASAPSAPQEPGVGDPRWSVALERCRGGRPGAWLLEWRDGALAAATTVTTTPKRTTPAPATAQPVTRLPVGRLADVA
ncbi:ImuA family protein [Azospirillum sp. sgz302134]